jgi:dienelactone hydrolase
MLRSYIEGREKRWHARDTNRYPRPFEWGLEHVGIENGRDPGAALADYADRAVGQSPDFYGYAATRHYQLDGDALSFPSALETAHVSNNTVRARFHAAPGRFAVIVLPQWNAQPQSHLGLCRILQRFGIASLRLSLPYHDERRPSHLERAEYLVGPNLGQTIAANRQAVLDVRRAADWLEAQGYDRLGILGTSIGSCVGFLSIAHDERFLASAFIHVSSHFADVVWTGLSTTHVRRSLEPFIDLERLRRIWSPISPYPFIDRLARRGEHRMLVLAGTYDLTFPFELSALCFQEFDRRRISYERVLLPCGHYTMGNVPFSAIAGFRVVKFLRRFRG